MSKRGAENTLTRENLSDDEEIESTRQVDMGGWKEASADKLAKREIIKVKRNGQNDNGSSSSSTLPSFNFAAPSSNGSSSHTNNNNHDNKKESAPSSSTPATAVPLNNSLSKFLMSNDKVECSSCLVQYDKNKAKCPACETPNPDAPADSSSTKSSTKSSSSDEKPIFTFGTTPSTTSVSSTTSADSKTTTAPVYSFGAAAGAPFSFSVGSIPAFSFGTAAASSFQSFSSIASTTPSDTNNTNKPLIGFTLGSSISTSLPASLSSSAEKNNAFEGAKREKSGEENDTIRHVVKAKLYELKTIDKPIEPTKKNNSNKNNTEGTKKGEDDDGTPLQETKETKKVTEYVALGEGEAHINTFDTESGEKKGRIVMRTEKTQRLILNAPIHSTIMPTIQGDKYARFHSIDIDGKPAIFLLKVNNKNTAEKIVQEIETIVKEICKK